MISSLLVVALCLVASALSQNCGPTDGFYFCSQIPSSMEAATGNAVWPYTVDDTVAGPFNLPFNFYFYRTLYTQVSISSNGFLLFAPRYNFDQGCCSGQQIPNQYYQSWSPNNIIAGFWTDLWVNPNTVTYETLGTAPNRRFVVHWNVRFYYQGQGVNMEIKLFEGSNDIEVHYGNVGNDNHIVSVGIEDNTAVNGISYYYGYQGQSSLSNTAVRFSGQATATCGNGIVEPTEDCDGGICCDSNCQFVSSTVTCRPSAGICDVVEFCTGASANCPSNSFLSTSSPCQEDFGVCDTRLQRFCPGTGPTCSGIPVPALNSAEISWLGYNVISFNGFSGNTGSVGGRLAVKNNLSVGSGFSIGSDIQSQATTYSGISFALVVGHNANWASGELFPDDQVKQENAFVGETFTGASYLAARVTETITTLGHNLDADFESARSYYSSISDNFNLETPNVVTSVQYSAIFFTCNSDVATRYIASVGASTFGQTTWYSVENCNPDASWVINVQDDGSDVVFQGDNFPGIAERVLYNIRGSRTVHIGSGVAGNILAPHCTVSQTGGVTLGLLIAGDISAALSTLNPFCNDFRPYGITTRSAEGVSAGDTEIPVASFSALIAGDSISIGSETTTITARQTVDGQDVLIVDPALTGDHASGSTIATTVTDTSAPRVPDTVEIITTPQSSASAVFASVILVVAALFA
jgi:choice-of-anchor A domain-containing protein